MSPDREMPSWTRSPAELQDRFAAALTRFPEAERRQMFGYPAAFVHGNMWTGLHQMNWVVRLPAADRTELLAIPGAANFEPMPGRPMTGFATLPPSVLEDPTSLHAWLSRAWQAGLTMPPKEPKVRKAPKGS
jgi:hypothetical protein